MTKIKKQLATLFAGVLVTLVAFCGPVKAQLDASQTWGGTSTGSGNAQTIVVHNVALAADLLGVPIRFIPGAFNTGATTLTITLDGGGSIGPLNILKQQQTLGITSLSANDFQTTQVAVVTYDGTQFQCLSCTRLSLAPTYTILNSAGSATYTVKSLCTRLEIRMVGGGGGGGGTGTSGQTAGGAGTGSVFSSTTTGGGGGGGANATTTPGAPGSAGSGGTTGTGTQIFRENGSSGTQGGLVNGTITQAIAGSGGPSAFGNGAVGTYTVAASVASPGAGGAGQGGGSGTIAASSGGGSGEYVEFVVTGPLSATYAYTVGASGSAGGAGTGGSSGSAGGVGQILIKEWYSNN